MTMEPIRVLTIDDHPTTRGGIAYALQTEADIRVVGEGCTGAEAVALHAELDPDVTLMDLRLPDMSGITAMEIILEKSPEARFIVLTTYDGDVPARRAYRSGACGYLLKNMLSRDLVQVLRRVRAGEIVVPPEVAASMARFANVHDLTQRETEVLRLVAGGNSNKIIALKLNVSAETVKGHMKLILGKLGAEDRTHAVTIAQQRGFFAE